MSIINKIKEIIQEFIIEKYFDYLDKENILFIKNDLHGIVDTVYCNNIKSLKTVIRERLRANMESEYPSGSIENILLDIFQDRKINVNRLVDEIKKYQKDNFIELERYTGDANIGIGLNLEIDGSFCKILSIKSGALNMEIIKKYKYIYSINDIILNEGGSENSENSENIINILRENIKGQSTVKLGLYGKKYDNDLEE